MEGVGWRSMSSCLKLSNKHEKSLLLTLLREKVSVRVARLRYAATRPLNIGRLSTRAQMVQLFSPEKMLEYFLAQNACKDLIQFLRSMTGL